MELTMTKFNFQPNDVIEHTLKLGKKFVVKTATVIQDLGGVYHQLHVRFDDERLAVVGADECKLVSRPETNTKKVQFRPETAKPLPIYDRHLNRCRSIAGLSRMDASQKIRRCLRCDVLFISCSPGHRKCPCCTNKQCNYMDMVPSIAGSNHKVF